MDRTTGKILWERTATEAVPHEGHQPTGTFANYSPVTDGKPWFTEQNLEGINQVYASPVGVADRVYCPGRNGVTVVIRNADTFEVLATNKLDDGLDASPAVIGDELYIRGNKSLYCLARK